jgi:ABC-type glycerol-3-phosphate transport system substrate-binding protein
VAGFWGAAAAEYYDPVTLRAHVPEESEQAWSWYYDGIWGSQPFIASGDLANSASFGSGNVFASGRAAMAAASSWYTCCLDDFAAAGNVFQLAALPASPGDGALHARLEIGSFHIFKNTGHPDEAFETVSYLITSARVAQGLDVLSAINGLWDLYIQSRAERYPFVSSWQPLLDGITQADMSLANGYLPNYGEAWIRVGTFGDRLATIAALDLDAELSTLEDDLTAIFQR